MRAPRAVSMGVIGALVAALLSFAAVLTMAPAAHAASSPPPTLIFSESTFFAYLKSGERLVVDVGPGPGAVEPVTRVTAPDGTLLGGNGTYTATTDGVFTIDVDAGEDSNHGADWDIVVRDGEAEMTGRIWTDNYQMRQDDSIDQFQLWMVNNTGYVYSVLLSDFNGLNSYIRADSVGNAVSDIDCATPLYQSTEREDTVFSGCGEQYRLFFEEPSADLPETAQSPAGIVPVLPTMLSSDDLEITDLTFIPANPNTSNAGTLTWTPPQRYSGGYTIDIDADGNGSFDDDVDLTIPFGADGTGTNESFEFDGLDAQGNAIGTCVPVNARVHFDRLGEIHLVQYDVEQRSGLEMTRLNGAGAPDSTIYWDDASALSNPRENTTPVRDGLSGVDSSTGVHGWDFDRNSWGNERSIDDWAYLPVDKTAATVAIGGSCLSIEKTSDMTEDARPGDTVTYEVTATNDGDIAYTEDSPAVVTDDLTSVLDDAVFNEDATASASDGTTISAPSYEEPLLGWTGALAPGESVTISYSVTLTAGGDGSVRNVAFAGDGETPVCDPPTEDGTDPDTGIPCAEVDNPLPKLSVTKTADRTDLPKVGETVTYTVTVTNEGPGDYTADAPASFEDDLSDVIDDATFDESSIDTTTGDASYSEPELAWSGALASGESATVSYTLTYTGEGDRMLRNAACVPEDDVAADSPPCTTVSVPGAALSQSKSVDPSSGTAVRAGQELTYTLTFESIGETAVTVDTYDDLSELTDDATLVGEPMVDGTGLVAAVDDDRILISGSIEAGETVTVTYTVVVKSFDEQGDHVIGNHLADPDGNACAEGECTTENRVKHLTIDKTSDAADDVTTGDTVTYEVTVTNDGEADFTAEEPASATDDLTEVLDDASYNGDVSASAGEVSYADSVIRWSGALDAGDSVTFTYTVIVTNLGDHELLNTATLPSELCDDADAPCDSTVVTLLPNVTPSKTSDPASGEDVVAGQDVTYTLTFTNDGKATGAVDSTDDLSDVLDDADLTGEPVSSSDAITTTVSDDAIRIVGEIEPGETVTVTYVVTIRPDGERGDNLAKNVLTPDTPPFECAEGDAECEPFVPPTTEHPMGELAVWKSVDPASGATVQPGQVVTYTLHFANTGTADVDVARDDVLTQVLDDADVTALPIASSDTLTVSEITDARFSVTGSLAAGESETVSYAVTVKADGERGDDRLGNFIVESGGEPPATCEPADDERATCTVNHVSNVVVSKSADPESGDVTDGQTVTYTITFTNVSTNPEAEDGAVDYTDHMSDVLDDATLSGAPAASDDAVTATVSEDTIVMAGAIPSGETISVTYAVTVKSYDEQGNHVLGNVVAVTGEKPICAPDSPLCTSHDTTKPNPPVLPWTGADGALPALAAALLLLIGGGMTLIIMRRRRESGDIE